MRNLLSILMLAVAVAVLSGCAATTSKHDIDPRHAYAGPAGVSADAPTAFVRSVLDARIFTKGTGNPADPTPAIESAAERDTYIGRKRGGFGNAWGKMRLADGKTVTGTMRKVIEDALTESGFKVLHDEAAIDNNTLILNATVNKFWCWIDMHFWTISLITDIGTDIKTATDTTFNVTVQEDLRVAAGTEKNQMKSIHSAITKYRTALTGKLRELKAQAQHRLSERKFERK